MPGASPSAVATLCADADLRPNRMGELMSMASSVLPQLDLASGMLGVGACCGTTGAAGTLANASPVLCVSNSDKHYRCARVVRPA